MISVIIPLYNKEKVVCKTLESVASQTMMDYEVIVVNDGSTDNSSQFVRSYLQDNPSFASKVIIIDQPNAGVAAARNKGIKMANYPYIAFLDADDLWDKEYLSIISSLINTFPDCSVYASAYKIIYDGNEEVLPFHEVNNEAYVINNYFTLVSSKQPFYTSSVVVKKDALINVGLFPEGIKFGEDLIVWAKLAAQYDIAYVTSTLVTYVMTTEARATSNSYQMTSIEDDFVGQEMILLNKECAPVGLSDYIFMWCKIRFVMMVFAGNRMMAWKEYVRMMPKSLFNLDCYYHFALTLLPKKWYGFIHARVLKMKKSL